MLFRSDVVFSLETLKSKGHPSYRFYYQSILSAEKLGERKVKFIFAERENRELPLIAGELRILPKHYWESRDFEKTTLEPPLGSGPYRIAEFEPGRHIVYERVEDYWAADLPVNRGQYNFDRLRVDYFRDASVIRQALKAGDIEEGVRLTRRGLKSAANDRERVAGYSNLCAGLVILERLGEALAPIDSRRYRVEQVYRWLYGRHSYDPALWTDLSKELRSRIEIGRAHV